MNNSPKRSARFTPHRRQRLQASRVHRTYDRRGLAAEPLEHRVLLAGDTTMAWHNAAMPMDTSGNGVVTPMDALAVVRELNVRGARQLSSSVAPVGMVDVNGDGFVSPSDSLPIIQFLNAASGEGHEKVKFRLSVTPRDNEDPLTTLNRNQDFYLRVYTTDLTDNPEGVFSAYLDVEYDANLADADGTINYSTDFDDGKSGNVDVDGLLDEIGGFNQNPPNDGSLEQLVLSVPMRTDNNLGTIHFTGNPSDILPIHEVLIQADTTPIPGDEILFENVSVPIVIEGTATAIDDVYELNEDTTLTRSAAEGVLSNDISEGTVTASLVSGPSHGTLGLNADGSFDYTPNQDYNGPDSFTYVATDGINPSNEATVSLTIQPINDAPVAVDDDYFTDLETALDRSDPSQGLLANDSDVDSPTLTVLTNQIVGPENGQLAISPDGGFSYIPNIDFSGIDSFTYVITDGVNVSEAATVTIEVGADPDAPVANTDTYQTPDDTQLVVDAESGVLANDVDPNGATMFATLVSTTSNGVLELNIDGSFVYTPNASFVGSDSFEYTAVNVALVSRPATVTIEVVDINLPPIAQTDTYATDEDVELTVSALEGVLANDSDPENETITANLVTGPGHGSVSLSEDGSFVYTPDANFHGTDGFTYAVSDGEMTENGSVEITVAPVQDVPVAQDDAYDVVYETPLTVSAEEGVLSNDEDADGTALTAEIVDVPVNGTVELNADGSFEYTPNAEFIGLDSFTYAASDGEDSVQATVTFNVQPVPTGPLVTIRLETTDLDGNGVDTVNAGDFFLLHMYVRDTSPEPLEGVFAAYADIEWQSSLAFVNGSLSYDVDFPNGHKGNTSVAGLVDEAGAFTRLNEAGPIEVRLVSVPMQATGSGVATFSTNPADVLPFGNVLLFDTLDIAVPADRIDYGSVALNVVGPSAPVAVPDTYEADNGTLSVTADEGVLLNDANFSGNPLTANLVTTTSHGTLELNDDGSFTYTAEVGYVGADSFTYFVTEDGVESNVTTVSINVGDPTPSNISGHVYFDTNDNGIREETEHGFGGVTVTLKGTDIFGNEIEQQAVTTRAGSYSFLNISAGEYTVSQEQPEIVIDGKDTIQGELSPLNDAFVIELEPSLDLTEVNFGERGLMPQFIRSTLFMSSRIQQGAGIGIGPDGTTSWYCADASWSGIRDLRATLTEDGSTVIVTGVNNAQQLVRGAFSTTNANVRVLGNAQVGYLVQLIGTLDSFAMTPVRVLSAQAVDEIFGG